MNILNPINIISSNKLQLEIFNTIFKKDENDRFVELVDTINSNISFAGKKEQELNSEEYFSLTLLKETVAKYLLKFDDEYKIVKLLISIHDSHLNYIDYLKLLLPFLN